MAVERGSPIYGVSDFELISCNERKKTFNEAIL
jgi:hypothetical protein